MNYWKYFTSGETGSSVHRALKWKFLSDEKWTVLLKFISSLPKIYVYFTDDRVTANTLGNSTSMYKYIQSKQMRTGCTRKTLPSRLNIRKGFSSEISTTSKNVPEFFWLCVLLFLFLRSKDNPPVHLDDIEDYLVATDDGETSAQSKSASYVGLRRGENVIHSYIDQENNENSQFSQNQIFWNLWWPRLQRAHQSKSWQWQSGPHIHPLH